MSEIELKACPFCGGAPMHTVWGDAEYDRVECESCGVATDHFSSPEDVAEAWNTRAPHWQPIQTVPHGKWVYVGTVGAPCGSVAMLADYWINPDMQPDQYAERATHWQPLPAPPEVSNVND